MYTLRSRVYSELTLYRCLTHNSSKWFIDILKIVEHIYPLMRYLLTSWMTRLGSLLPFFRSFFVLDAFYLKWQKMHFPDNCASCLHSRYISHISCNVVRKYFMKLYHTTHQWFIKQPEKCLIQIFCITAFEILMLGYEKIKCISLHLSENMWCM